MDPALLPQLTHDGVDPGEARPALGPLSQRFGVPVPGNLHANRVSLHAIEAGVVGGCSEEELTP